MMRRFTEEQFMRIIVGLGNPGDKYAHTRHNVGFDVVGILAEKENIPVKKIKCHALVGEGVIDGEKVVLALPQTYMNLSGQAVVDLMNWYKVSPEDVLIIVDDIDLPMGQVRIRPHGGAGTHNGLRNIVYLTGSDSFPRIRVGVGQKPEGWDLADWVLSKYQTEEDRKVMFDAYLYAADAARAVVTKGVDKAMNLFNKR